MRTHKTRIATLFALFTLVALIAAPASADSTDVGTMISNATMELKVKTALLDEIGWDMLDTDVEAAGGHITLLGEAESKAHCELAKEVALSVDGVHEVDNELTIAEEPTDTPVGEAVTKAELEVKDAILESRVKSALIGELGRNAFDIEVEASDGHVSLRGELSSSQHEDLALATARDISGVEDVIDLLSVSS